MASSDFEKNEELLKSVAMALGPLLEKVAFVGGATTILHLTDDILDVRATMDVDVIIDATRSEFCKAEERLRGLGFKPDPKLICRHRKGDLVIDFMPTDEEILGFSSRWYAEALREARPAKVAGFTIKVLRRREFGRHLQRNEFLSALEGHMPRDASARSNRITADLSDLASGA